ncbi:MAG: hypothetical protein U5R31_12415 [Acidimicrobiia bacterium]|nr:hypothetical protein [Acidimicrobiia bacterium]
MADPVIVSAPVKGMRIKEMSFETGRLAGQANGAVLAKLGETTVLVTATAARSPRPGADFFPLTVDIEERQYAAGKIPGSFFRREGRASDKAILTCRLIDRPLRPSFPDGFRNEVHVVGTVFGADQHNPYDVLAINAASAALMLSRHPLRRAAGRGAPRLHGRRRVDRPSHLPGGRGRHLRDGRRGPSARRRRRGRHDGRGRRHREGLAATTRTAPPRSTRPRSPPGSRTAKSWISRVDRAPGAARRRDRRSAASGPTAVYTVATDYSDEVLAAVDAAATPHRCEAQQIADKAERDRRRGRAARRRWWRRSCERCRRPRRRRRRQIKAAFRSLTKDSRAARASSTRASASTGEAPATSARCPPTSASSTPRTAPRCSSGARPRCSTSPRWACRAWSS